MARATQALSRWRGHRVTRFLLVVGVAVGMYLGYGYVTGPSRISDQLHERLNSNPTSVDIRVTSNFPPEEFHISIYQKLGSMRGVEGSTAKLYSVSPKGVRALSRYYWIDRIDLAPDAERGK